MIAAAEAERKVMITLQLIPDQQNNVIAKQFEDQVLNAERLTNATAEKGAKKRSEIRRREAGSTAAINKQQEADERREREHNLREKAAAAERAEKDEIMRYRRIAKRLVAERNEKEQEEKRAQDAFDTARAREQDLREKRAGKLMVRDAKAQQKALHDEAKAVKKYQQKMTTDILAAQKMQVESKQKATEAGVAALQGTMDLVEGLATLGLVSEENFEKFAKGFSKVQAGFKALKGFTELVWKGREALIALNSATKAQATANALLAASNNKTAATQGALTAAQRVGGGTGGMALGIGGAAVGGLAVAAAAGAVAIYSLIEASRQEAEARKKNTERLKRDKEQIEKNERDTQRRIIERVQGFESYLEKQEGIRSSERSTKALQTRVNYELGGGNQNAIEAAKNDRLIALREVQAAESEMERAKKRTALAQYRAVNQLKEANRNLIEADLRRLQVMRDQQKVAEDQVKASREAVKVAQDTQKSELQRYAELSKYQQGRLKEIAEKKNKGENISERDIRLLEATGQGADIVRDYRSKQGIAAGGKKVLAAINPAYRASQKSEADARDSEFEAIKIEARVEDERRDLNKVLPLEAQRQEEIRKKRLETQTASANDKIRRLSQLNALNEAEQKDPSQDPNNGRRNPFEPDPVYQLPPQPRQAPQRQPDQKAVADATDQVTQSGIGVENGIKSLLDAMNDREKRILDLINKNKLIEDYYANV
ncbi:hypothetical protein [Gimesia maris]|uniref:hypothetical protein n=1 Tax=Gimesia maris TaxID=122 RepID=UPI0032EE3185